MSVNVQNLQFDSALTYFDLAHILYICTAQHHTHTFAPLAGEPHRLDGWRKSQPPHVPWNSSALIAILQKYKASMQPASWFMGPSQQQLRRKDNIVEDKDGHKHVVFEVAHMCTHEVNPEGIIFYWLTAPVSVFDGSTTVQWAKSWKLHCEVVHLSLCTFFIFLQ